MSPSYRAFGEIRFAALQYSLFFHWTPERRQLDYLRYLGASDRPAKETQMFGLAPWLIERYGALGDKIYKREQAALDRKGMVSTALSLFGTLGYYAAYVLILWRAVTGAISLGTLTFLTSSFSRSRDLCPRRQLYIFTIFTEVGEEG